MQKFRQPNFIVWFEADFQEFYNYDIALKTCNEHSTNSRIFFDTSVSEVVIHQF